MWFEGPFYKYSIGTILILLVILLLYYTFPIFYPILWFIGAIFLPILFSTILYYMLRPIVIFLERWIPKIPTIIIVYIFIIITIFILAMLVLPGIQEVNQFISPENFETLNTKISDFSKGLNFNLFSNLPFIKNLLSDSFPKINSFLYQSSINLITTLASITISLLLTPIVLFYFLKDDNLFSKFILKFVPSQFQEEVQKILTDIDTTLSEFVISQITIATIIGLFLCLGYLVIGLPHAVSLALFAAIFYIIPILGTFIALIPALIAAATVNLGMSIKVIIVMIAAHLLEVNIVAPRLISTRLKIHPLTVILLLLAAGSLYGLLGVLLITPTYAIIKVILWNLYKISRLRYVIAKSKATSEAVQDSS